MALLVWGLFPRSPCTYERGFVLHRALNSRVQGEALSELRAVALLPRAPAAFTWIQCSPLTQYLLFSV